MRTFAIWRRAAAGALLGALAACGGGGGGDAPTEAPGSMPTVQGNVLATNRPLDLAIVGAGVFAFVADDGAAVYSRMGRLDVDRDGHLVHAEGWRVAGRADDAAPGDRAEALPALPYRLPGAASTQLSLVSNLDARWTMQSPGQPFVPDDPGTYNGATSVLVYDANGNPVPLTLYFTRTALHRAVVHLRANGVPLPGPVAELAFLSSGQVDPSATASPSIDIPAPDATRPPIPALRFDWSGMTMYGASFGVWQAGTDGYPPGRLASVDASRDGHLAAHYDNGQTRPAGQLLLARFALGDQLQRIGDTGLRCVRHCAAPIVAPPGEMLLGEVVSGALEEQP